ncbi:MAG: hypothetical protein GXO27_02940 [Chlorobi bacterium]|nr:hypothetical protein [Chlorobiota bacterium]
MKKVLRIFLFALALLPLRAQQDSVLMYIGDEPVTVAEFERMYTKNLDLVQDPRQKDIDYYKDLYIRYRLQLADAKAKGYDKDPGFLAEFNRYRRELARQYLILPGVTDSLVREAYDRMQKDVNVSHIMVALPPNPTPADTLKARKEIYRIYQRARKGEDFGELARRYSDDRATAARGGNVGWFTVFQTVYPFESAAYRTPVGQISEPFRTKYGYHIIKKEGERPAVYKVQAAHIMVLKKGDPEAARQKIQDIYRRVKEGEESFEELARRYSEDMRTARQGGIMPPFGVREKVPEFEEAVFALENPGDITPPFETEKAWHIAKLIKKYPVPPFEDIRKELEVRVAKSDRGELGRQKLIEKLRNDIPVEVKGSLAPVYRVVGKSFFEGQWEFPKNFTRSDEVVAVINGEYPLTYGDFLAYLYRHQLREPAAYKRKKAVIDELFRRFLDEELYRYYERNLEKFHPRFAQTVKEYYDGLLLFNYKSREIWEKALRDTTGLREFYEQHKDRYRMPEQARYIYIETEDKKLARKLYKMLKKGASLEEIMQTAGNKADVEVKVMIPVLARQATGGKKALRFLKGDKWVVKGIVDIIPERIPPFEEVKGKVMSDYQQYLEQQLVRELERKYPVRINEEAWQRLRAKYKN